MHGQNHIKFIQKCSEITGSIIQVHGRKRKKQGRRQVSSTLKMVEECYSEMSVSTTQFRILEDRNVITRIAFFTTIISVNTIKTSLFYWTQLVCERQKLKF